MCVQKFSVENKNMSSNQLLKFWYLFLYYILYYYYLLRFYKVNIFANKNCFLFLIILIIKVCLNGEKFAITWVKTISLINSH